MPLYLALAEGTVCGVGGSSPRNLDMSGGARGDRKPAEEEEILDCFAGSLRGRLTPLVCWYDRSPFFSIFEKT